MWRRGLTIGSAQAAVTSTLTWQLQRTLIPSCSRHLLPTIRRLSSACTSTICTGSMHTRLTGNNYRPSTQSAKTKSAIAPTTTCTILLHRFHTAASSSSILLALTPHPDPNHPFAKGGDDPFTAAPGDRPRAPELDFWIPAIIGILVLGGIGVGIKMYRVQQQKKELRDSSVDMDAAKREAMRRELGLPEDAGQGQSPEEEDPLALHKLPSLIREHQELPFWQRAWFYTRLVVRGIALSVIWIPTLTIALLVPNRTWMRLVVHMLEWSGPVFIKLGQWASTRPDLFPDVVCQTLARLQSAVTTHSFYTSLQTCKNNFGQSMTAPDGTRLIVEEKAVGSGSMGQVHHGFIVSPSGERTEVAIKVLHPHLHEQVTLDLTLLYYAALTVTKIPYSELQWLAIPEMLIQFTGFMSSHLDLVQEARNMDVFRQHFKDDPNILFPRPMYPFVGPHVLVQSLAHGIPLGKFLNDEEYDRERIDYETDPEKTIAERITKAHVLKYEQMKREAEEKGLPPPPPPQSKRASPLHAEIARLGFQMYLHMLIQDNYVHSDLHPGNIFVQLPGIDPNADTNSLKPGQVQTIIHNYTKSSSENLKSQINLVILDSGLVSVLSPKNRRNFLSLFGALILGDGRLAARLILADAPRQACHDPWMLQEDMHEIVSQIPLENLGRVDLGRLLSEVMNCVRKHHVKLESDFASIVISLAIIEGIGRQLDPDLSLIHEAVPVMLKDKETRSILLKTAGVQACAKLGLIMAKEELDMFQQKRMR